MTFRDRIERKRKQKEQFYAESPKSPLSPDEQAAFEGFHHYSINEDYRVEATYEPIEDPEVIKVDTSTGESQHYLRVGIFHFELDGEGYSLFAYKADPEDDGFWVPFRDATAGEETYEKGRYLDIEPSIHQEEDTWIIDFNEAYNPTCAHTEGYTCPYPPGENELSVAIEAGEKAPQAGNMPENEP